MDNLTHALVGATMSRAIAGTAHRSPVWWTLLISSEIPDIDALYMLQGNVSYLINHRGWTHSLPGLVLLALGVALAVYLASRREGKFRVLLAYSLLAAVVHVGLDALTSWGTGLLHPFRLEWVYLDILPIVDPVILFILSAGLLAARRRPWARRSAAAALAAVLVFTAVRGVLHYEAVYSNHRPPSTGQLLALPTFSPLQWRMVVEEPGGYKLGRLDLWSGAFRETARVPVTGEAEVPFPAGDPVNHAVLSFFRVPVFSGAPGEGGAFVLLRDLSYDRGLREVLLEVNNPVEPGYWYKVVR